MDTATNANPSIWRSLRNLATRWRQRTSPGQPRSLSRVNHAILCEQIGEEDAGLVMEAIGIYAQRTGKGTRAQPIGQADNPEILAIATGLQMARSVSVWGRPLPLPPIPPPPRQQGGGMAFNHFEPILGKALNRAQRRAGKGR
jgi:hypothetical protein